MTWFVLYTTEFVNQKSRRLAPIALVLFKKLFSWLVGRSVVTLLGICKYLNVWWQMNDDAEWNKDGDCICPKYNCIFHTFNCISLNYACISQKYNCIFLTYNCFCLKFNCPQILLFCPKYFLSLPEIQLQCPQL